MGIEFVLFHARLPTFTILIHGELKWEDNVYNEEPTTTVYYKRYCANRGKAKDTYTSRLQQALSQLVVRNKFTSGLLF